MRIPKYFKRGVQFVTNSGILWELSSFDEGLWWYEIWDGALFKGYGHATESDLTYMLENIIIKEV